MSNAADIILSNAHVYTVDASRSVAEAVAVKDGRIAYVGSDAGARALAGPQTDVIDLAGKMVLPGFIDSHMHNPEGAVLPLFEVRLPEGMPVDEYLPTIRAFAQTHPDLASIRGAGWDDSYFSLRGPTKDQLDDAVPDRPAVIRSCSFHSLWCNSRALELAGVTKDTPSPEYGIIEKDEATGEPTGTLHEAAQDLVTSKLPDYSTDQYAAAFEGFFGSVTGPCGITGCFDARFVPGHANAMEALARLESEGKLKARMRGGLYIDPSEPVNSQLDLAVTVRERYTGPLFQVKTVKFFADGSGYSIFLREPFAAVPPGFPDDYRGYPGWQPEELTAAAVKAAELGFRLHFHAIGDAAVRISLDAIEAAERALGRSDIRAAITHMFLLDEADLQRVADLQVIAVLQPIWMQRDAYYYQGYLPQLGEERCARMMPLKSLFDRGIVVASSTDFPITNPPAPLDGIAIGALRWHPLLSAPGDVWTAEERVSVPQMIESYTINGATANFVEDDTGSIEIGKSADLVVLNENILGIPAERIGFNWMGGGTAKVVMTMFQGKTVYRTNDLS
jgi:predicted amidohydrolase YtcJ